MAKNTTTVIFDVNLGKRPFVWVRYAVITSALKRLFVQSPLFKACMYDARVESEVPAKKGGTKAQVRYRCAHCGNLFPRKEVNVDHILPVIAVETGFVDFNTWIDREFVSVEIWDTSKDTFSKLSSRLQVLCEQCHSKKSVAENSTRNDLKSDKNEGKKKAKATSAESVIFDVRL